MKKILSFIVVATMLMATVLTASAAPTEMNIGLIPVLYAKSDMITIDGTIDDAEWDETNSKILSCKTNMATWTTEYPGEIQFFYSWGDEGLYMAAKVIDSTLTFTTIDEEGEDTIAMQDRFQIAFNPCGLIYDKAAGLFFSFYPTCAEGETPAVGTSGSVQARKHNWETGVEDNAQRITEAGYKGAYTVTEDGWDMEVILPWSLIASQDRVYDIIDYNTEADFCSLLDPKNEDRTKAFTQAIIAYVDMEEVDGKTNTARTATGVDTTNDWTVASYDITLKFYMEGESTDDKTVTKYTVDELKALFTDVDWTEYDKEQSGETEGEDVGDDTVADDTVADADDTAAATDAPATGDAATTTAGDSADDEEGGFPIWIVIVGVAVVAVAAVAIVIFKKKK